MFIENANSRDVRSSAVVMCRSFLWPEKRNPDPLTSVLLRFSPFRGFIIFTSRLFRCFARKSEKTMRLYILLVHLSWKTLMHFSSCLDKLAEHS